MAHVKKYTHIAIPHLFRHFTRDAANPSNTDIDPSRSHLNYCLGPAATSSPFEIYKQRLKQVRVYKRANTKTLIGWVVTCPGEITDREQQRAFFSATYDFLTMRYGLINVIGAWIHYDEGIKETVKDRWTGAPILDENGKPQTFLKYGHPHMHFAFIPVIDEDGVEKVYASKIIDRNELRSFHRDLQSYLDHHLPYCVNINNGVTARRGGTTCVQDLKRINTLSQEVFDLQHEIERLYDRLRLYEPDAEYNRERKYERDILNDIG